MKPEEMEIAMMQNMEKKTGKKIDNWTKNYNIHFVEFDTKTFDPFFNINSPDDLKEAKTIINNNY